MAKLNKKHNIIKGIAAACAAVTVVGGFTTTAYAANLGGIQRQIQIWVHGDQTTATMEVDENAGTYSISYTDEAGEERNIQGGGITVDQFGNERPVSEEEMLEHIDMPEVVYLDDGNIKVYYHSQEIDITDKFDKNDVCYTYITEGDKEFYMTITKNGGYYIDTTKYQKPSKH